MSNHHLALIGNTFISIICSIASIILLGLTSYMIVILFDNIEIFGTLVGFVTFMGIFMGTFISLTFAMMLFLLAIAFGINATDYDDYPKNIL